jgi:hypothetical protein
MWNVVTTVGCCEFEWTMGIHRIESNPTKSCDQLDLQSIYLITENRIDEVSVPAELPSSSINLFRNLSRVN